MSDEPDTTPTIDPEEFATIKAKANEVDELKQKLADMQEFIQAAETRTQTPPEPEGEVFPMGLSQEEFEDMTSSEQRLAKVFDEQLKTIRHQTVLDLMKQDEAYTYAFTEDGKKVKSLVDQMKATPHFKNVPESAIKALAAAQVEKEKAEAETNGSAFPSVPRERGMSSPTRRMTIKDVPPTVLKYAKETNRDEEATNLFVEKYVQNWNKAAGF